MAGSLGVEILCLSPVRILFLGFAYSSLANCKAWCDSLSARSGNVANAIVLVHVAKCKWNENLWPCTLNNVFWLRYGGSMGKNFNWTITLLLCLIMRHSNRMYSLIGWWQLVNVHQTSLLWPLRSLIARLLSVYCKCRNKGCIHTNLTCFVHSI